MGKRIFRGALFLSIVAAVLMGALAALAGYRMAEEQTETSLRQEAVMVASLRAQTDEAAFLQTLEGLKSTNRLTWILDDGTVVYDSQSLAGSMENHLEREEIVAAKETGFGVSKRYSDTLLEEQLYCAVKLEEGGYLRVAAAQRSAVGYLNRMVWVMVFGAGLIGLLAALLSKGWTARLVKPINELDLENPLNNTVYDELSPMLRRMAAQNRKLDSQWQELSRRNHELDAILGHMEEGLVFLDADRHVLMMNESAKTILHADKPVDGATLLSVYNRSHTLLSAVDTTEEKGNAHVELKASGRDYLLTVSRVKGEEAMVLLLQDVTEQNAAEQSRKRFSANVSHELRTPLTTISGYAELMQNGMMQSQDVPVFARKIYEESRRLLKLIEDIMHLSKLDEGYVAGRQEAVELLGLVMQVGEEMEPLAKERNVALHISGDEASVQGDPVLLDEMLRNLLENGVKYNKPDGQVWVRIENEGKTVRVTVEDTGIGIPAEHMGRVFERFYRVDKSRSKQIGGTGLGLSIVKHGAEYHHAQISMSSEMDVGTTVVLTFPVDPKVENV
ncbi:MAG: ATP-binding protein [Eubacteriales bacterium]|nr:ATP-binding protein [Eubacteriales bacterium]